MDATFTKEGDIHRYTAVMKSILTDKRKQLGTDTLVTMSNDVTYKKIINYEKDYFSVYVYHRKHKLSVWTNGNRTFYILGY